MGGQGNRGNCLGGSNGAGFGWENIDVWKFGVQYQMDDKWTFRAGYNWTDNPITPANVTFNIIAPGVVQNQYTVGTTYTIDKQSQNHRLVHVRVGELGDRPQPVRRLPANPAATETIAMKQYLFGRRLDPAVLTGSAVATPAAGPRAA